MSDSFLTAQHRQLRQQVRLFAATQVAPRVAEMEHAGAAAEGQDAAIAIAQDLVVTIARQGWIGATIDKAYGGMGAGHLAKTVIIEELSRSSAAVGAAVQASQLGAAKIIHYGSEEQKRQWLPKIATGSVLPTIAVTEAESGSHVLGMRMTAHRDGLHYVLNGRKVCVGNSHIADVHGVVARTGEGSRGLTAFLVESNRPGLTVAPHSQALGLRGFSFGELHFKDCRIPVTNRLGREGDGRDIADSSSTLYGRPNLTAVALGIHQAILDQTASFTSERTRYNHPLHQLHHVRLKVGHIRSRVMTSRLTAYHAAHLLDAGQACDPDLMNAKLTGVELVLDSARTAMEIHAAAGLMTDAPLERFLRDAHHIYAPAGTSDIQALRLAEAALGQSKGQWSQRLSALLALTPPPPASR
ncbi:acyl-CoA dehydrogenase family protein [Streptomyces chryseus]